MKNARFTRIACYLSYVTQAINLNLLPLFFVIFRNDFGLSTFQLSATVFITFFIQISVDSLVALLGDKVSLRLIIISALATSASGLVALSFLPVIIDPFTGILISVLLYSIGSGLLEVGINPIFDRLPKNDGIGFTFAHSFYCWGQMAVILVSALALELSGGAWRFLPITWAILPVVLCISFVFLPIPKAQESSQNGEKSAEKRQKKLGKGFLLFILLMICAGAAEQGVAQWASYFAEKGLGTTKLLGDLIGPCLFALFMAIGRTLFGMFGGKINLHRTLTVCAIASTVCYLAIAFVPSPLFSLAACALSGFAVSIMWPASLDLASSAFVCTTATFSWLSLAGDIGCTLGPSVNGIVSDIFIKLDITKKFAELLGLSCEQAALRIGFAVTSLFSVIMIYTLIRIAHRFFQRKNQ